VLQSRTMFDSWVNMRGYIIIRSLLCGRYAAYVRSFKVEFDQA